MQDTVYGFTMTVSHDKIDENHEGKVFNMEKTQITVKVDKAVKEEAVSLFHRMGMDQTTAINMFFRQTIAEKRLPFQPIVLQSEEELFLQAIANMPSNKVRFVDDKVIVNGEPLDKERHPEIYDWVVTE